MAEIHETGRHGEELAVKFLEAKGYVIFDRNYRFEETEIDIVAFLPDVLHFIEVKTRRNDELNDPGITIGKKKMKALGKAGSFYIWERKLNNMPAVFDVLAIGLDDPQNPVFRHYEDALRPENPYFRGLFHKYDQRAIQRFRRQGGCAEEVPLTSMQNAKK